MPTNKNQSEKTGRRMIRLADGRSAYGYWREPVTNQEIINIGEVDQKTEFDPGSE